MAIFYVNINLMIENMSMPTHGLKNGTNAIKLSTVDMIILNWLKFTISKNMTEITKCSTDMNILALIKYAICANISFLSPSNKFFN